MRPIVLENPDVVLMPPDDMPECQPLTAVKFTDDGVSGFVSVWKPSREEVAALAAGGSVVVFVAGSGHPPIALGVQDTAGNQAPDFG